MKTIGKVACALLIALVIPVSAFAHSGRTDSSGGHRDNKNKSGFGSYHYHCDGHPAHLHTDGCPYSKASSPKSTAKPSPKQRTSGDYDAELAALEMSNIPLPLVQGDRNEWVELIQSKLIELNYLFDKPDGVFGEKTKAAVEHFQGDYDFEATGIVTPDVYAAIIYWRYE